MQQLMTLIAVCLGIFAVITLRSFAVYSQFFVTDEGPGTQFQRFMRWFRFYKPEFSIALGIVSVFLSLSSFAHGSYPWGIGNAVFAFAAFTNFQRWNETRMMQVIRKELNNPATFTFAYFVVPTLLSIWAGGGQEPLKISGEIFEVPGAYLLALGFLSMKMQVWGKASHESTPYLVIVLVWDALLLTGALIDHNTPFICLEAYAVCLDSFVAIFILYKKAASIEMNW